MRRILVRIERTLVILVLFFFLSLVISTYILPAFGLHITVGASGQSMDPTILDGALTTWSDRVQFSDLEVGDIIIFREWADVTEKVYDQAHSTIAARREGEEPEEEEKPTYRDEGIEYAEDKYVMHRIVEIRQDDEYLDRALFTRGDNNRNLDPRPTFESGYVGVITWTMNYIGWPFRIMYVDNGFFWLVGVTVFLGAALLIQQLRRPDENSGGSGAEP